MAKKSCGKRPCCICRKWFQPNVRQKGRQKTCNDPVCKKERHRRQCEKWNNTNKEYFKNNYLGKKIEQVEKLENDKDENIQSQPCPKFNTLQADLTPSSRKQFALPYEILQNQYGTKTIIIIHYLATQIIAQTRDRTPGIP